jgi:hypothetical protein
LMRTREVHQAMASVLKLNESLPRPPTELELLTENDFGPLLDLPIESNARVFEIAAYPIRGFQELRLADDYTEKDVQEYFDTLHRKDDRQSRILPGFFFPLGMTNESRAVAAQRLEQLPNHPVR